MQLEIRAYYRHEGDFYTLMGPFFANRKYAQEMGGWQFYTKDRATWFVGLVDGQVVGFCSVIHERTHLFFDNFYVLKPYRGRGYSNLLSKKRIDYAKQLRKEIRVISDNPLQHRKYERDGFRPSGSRGRYTVYKWRPDKDASVGAAGIPEAQPMEPEQRGEAGNGLATGKHPEKRFLFPADSDTGE